MSTAMSTMGAGDLHLELRECGNQYHSLTVTTDEGDGMSIRADWRQRDPRFYKQPSPEACRDWAMQLRFIANYLERASYNPAG